MMDRFLPRLYLHVKISLTTIKRRLKVAFVYHPSGVCSTRMEVELDGRTVKSVKIKGGCDGNLQAVSRLVEGMNADEAIERIRGIRCGRKPTSCPDQLSIAIEKAMKEK